MKSPLRDDLLNKVDLKRGLQRGGRFSRLRYVSKSRNSVLFPAAVVGYDRSS